MVNDDKLRRLYKEGYRFLKSKINVKTLQKHLDYYNHCSPQTLSDVFKQMIQTLKNKQGYSNFIVDISKMDQILFQFEPRQVLRVYKNDWGSLFKEYKKEFGSRYKMVISNKKNAWVMYSKGVLSCANFLDNFTSFKEIDGFVKYFTRENNEFLIAALPMLLEKEIYGFGFPLACDFLKELGYNQYGKPDVHLKEIFTGLKLVETQNDYEIFKLLVRIGKIVGKAPVIVDKVFWLIGSGKFHLDNIEIGSKKKEFINLMKCKIATTAKEPETGTLVSKLRNRMKSDFGR